MLRGEATSSLYTVCGDMSCVEIEWSGCYRELEALRGWMLSEAFSLL